MKRSFSVKSLACAGLQIYRRTYSWAQNNDIASRGAVITISRTSANPRFSEEDIERGVSHEIQQVPEVLVLLLAVLPNGNDFQ